MSEQNYRIRIKLGESEIEAEGDKEFVERHIEEFKKELPNIAKDLPQETNTVIPENPEEGMNLEKLSLAEFYKQKQPKDHNETVVVFAYWLTEKEHKGEFKTNDISACFDEARLPKPKNVGQHITSMASAKKAYLTGSRKGWYKLTLTGEEFVETELPRKNEK